MVHFVGAGCGAPDLITVRGQRLLRQADLVIYAGSLVNPALLEETKPSCEKMDSAAMTLEEVLEAILRAEAQGKTTVRLHSGDPSLYGAIGEQIAALREKGIPYDVTPGVSAFAGAAASMGLEYTLPGVSQSLILTRMAGRTPVPESEGMASLASHHASMAIYLSTGLLEELRAQLLAGGMQEDTPAAIVYKATWPEEKQVLGTVGRLPQMAQDAGIRRTALILVGEFLLGEGERSRLYDPAFGHGYRQSREEQA